jgi:hypothetical protein
MLAMGAIWGYNGHMKDKSGGAKMPEIGADRGREELRIYLSPEIKTRLETYAKRIGGNNGNASAVVLGWIMERLPESEAKLIPSMAPATPRGVSAEKQPAKDAKK